jgi:hypothetical protein
MLLRAQLAKRERLTGLAKVALLVDMANPVRKRRSVRGERSVCKYLLDYYE